MCRLAYQKKKKELQCNLFQKKEERSNENKKWGREKGEGRRKKEEGRRESTRQRSPPIPPPKHACTPQKDVQTGS